MNEMTIRGKLPSAEEITLIKKFLDDTTLFLGPDPEIMQNHDIMPRTAIEDAAIAQVSDAHTVAKIRDRIQAGCDEGYEMVEQMGAGTFPAERLDAENIDYASLAPVHIADAILHVINQPWGVSIGDITVRGAGDHFIL